MNVLRLFKAKPRIEKELIDRYREISTPNLSDCMERCYGTLGIHVVGDSLKSLGGKSMVGTAFTVKTRPGDNLVVHKALDLAQPGDILVIDARGQMVNAILGELMTLYATHRGIAGIVVDGAIRDSNAISDGKLPVFSKGVSHLGPYKSGPGEIHGTIQVGGVVINDGDLIVGDHDGIAVVPRDRVNEVIVDAEKIIEKEHGIRKAIAAGAWDRSWIDPSLQIIEIDDTSK